MDRHRLILLAFVICYCLAGLALAIIYWNYEFIFYGLVMIVLVSCVWLVDRRVRLPLWVMSLLAAWGLLHLLGGTLPIPLSVTEPTTAEGLTPPPVLYNLRIHPLLPKYDQCVHAFGFFASTLASWRCLQVFVEGGRDGPVAAGRSLSPTPGPLFAAAMIGMGLSAMNEVIEFAATRIMPGTNVGGYVNTGWDLVSNLVGCTAAVILIRLSRGVL